jgi:diguanylate cyclase (GGDEF)-like protein
VGVVAGLFPIGEPIRTVVVAWIIGYHLLHAWYVLALRIPGQPQLVVEVVTPLLDVFCITLAWLALADSGSPFWVIYLYALVGYTRRYHGFVYIVLASYIIANLAAGWIVVHGAADTTLATVVPIAVAMALLAHAIGTDWRRAERRARWLAETDPLTGISNRRVFLDQLVAYSEDQHSGYSILMLDLDDFKRLNDEYGHLHGDAVLVSVAQALSHSIREGDLVARYGGEEFIVAMPGCGIEEATFVAERLRRTVAETTTTTVSIGCAARYPGERAQGVIRRADNLLLLVKRNGKNAVLTAPPLPGERRGNRVA